MSSASGVDRISYLPENVIERILTCLPITEAVRTSILSRSWRYRWSNLSEIVFKDYAIPMPEPYVNSELKAKLVRAIDQVLLLHRGPIHRFLLYSHLNNCKDIDRWILFLSRNGIRSFTLHELGDEEYKVPSCLFSCKNLSYLLLNGCDVCLPEWFIGFKVLTVLDLQYVLISDENLENLISACSNLKELSLESISGCSRLRICAPELEDLWLDESFNDLCLENTPRLSNASLQLLLSSFGTQNGEDCNMIKVLGYLPNLEKLSLFSSTLESLSEGDVPMRLPMTSRIEDLSIYINFADIKEMAAAFCIFRSSPLLETLEIEAESKESSGIMCEEYFWKVQDLDCSFDRLETMDMKKFTGIQSEMRFIEFVLANAPVLQSLHIEFEKNIEGNDGKAKKILKELLNFRRTSASAKIVFPTL